MQHGESSRGDTSREDVVPQAQANAWKTHPLCSHPHVRPLSHGAIKSKVQIKKTIGGITTVDLQYLPRATSLHKKKKKRKKGVKKNHSTTTAARPSTIMHPAMLDYTKEKIQEARTLPHAATPPTSLCSLLYDHTSSCNIVSGVCYGCDLFPLETKGCSAVRRWINTYLVLVCRPHVLDDLLRLRLREVALLGDDLDEGGVHLARHVGRVAADVDVRPLLEQVVDLLGALLQAVLHVDLLGALPREGRVKLEPVTEDLLVLL